MKEVTQREISLTLDYLKKGKVIISPTDTIYGLLGDATNPETVKRIFNIKKRSFEKPLPIFVPNIEEAKRFVFIEKEDFLKKHWPGKLTAILKATKEGEKLGKGILKNGKIGIRIPNYDFVLQVLEKLGKPLTSTSANLSGCPGGGDFNKIVSSFVEEKPDLAVNGGKLKESESSSVIDLSNNNFKVLRNGSISIPNN